MNFFSPARPQNPERKKIVDAFISIYKKKDSIPTLRSHTTHFSTEKNGSLSRRQILDQGAFPSRPWSGLSNNRNDFRNTRQIASWKNLENFPCHFRHTSSRFLSTLPLSSANLNGTEINKKHENITNNVDPSNDTVSNSNEKRKPQHCNTCTCDHEPPPIPAPPKWSFHKRVLPQNLTALSSPEGKKLFTESLVDGYAESYFPLAEQFLTQGEPAYCGLSTLVMVLNALSIDPNVRWKSGWRWFDDEMIMTGCCLDPKIIQEIGITMDQFKMMGRCNGAIIDMFRPIPTQAVLPSSPPDDSTTSHFQQQYLQQHKAPKHKHRQHHVGDINLFRSHVKQYVQLQEGRSEFASAFLVVSYLRSALQQTGDGHFSPIAAYHMETDQVLILDVARFKYTPHWVSLEELYQAMTHIDTATDMSRGWFVVNAPKKSTNKLTEMGDKKRPGELVNHGKDICPLGDIKVTFCSVRNMK